jgi:prepilin-type N-terminal cleavage/methylation domain-containing protein
MTRPKKSASAGYTLVEVMVAVAIMTVGSLGVLALHEATTVGNMTSRNTATATAITRTWLERLEREALSWNAAGQPPTGPTTINIATVPVAPATPGVWAVPAAAPVLGTTNRATFDHHGVETATAANMRFCTHIRLQWVVPNQAIRADVRTAFGRTAAITNCVAPGGGGGAAAITADLASAAPQNSAVYGSTVVRWTRLVP